MNVTHGYSSFPDRRDGVRLFQKAVEAGVDHFDTATLYGHGVSEELVGEALGGRRDEIFLASKCGLRRTEDGRTVVDGEPASIKRQAEASLRRLGTDAVDLYYLHRLDPNVPVEESVGALAELVQEGKIRSIGLSEVSVETLKRAEAVHHIAAVQNEFSLATRNPELGMLDACRELGTTFVAFSPLSRALLTGTLHEPWTLPQADIRSFMPRFSAENFPANASLVAQLQPIADRVGATLAQLALAWVHAHGEHVISIPGTARRDHLLENLGADALELDAETVAACSAIVNRHTVHGARYTEGQQSTIDSEVFAEEFADAAQAAG
ncbi:aldo/keto reductase [Zhihengliuella flava]|uniref:Aryl-alcohol dehydrogenase-like predicted oxidoreductase n=1 Tax=Zhihengliuella flava TaxID=1285193 RepID=A0A931GG13_9MICC|nr:aldo/keto reductase [Zhihengliuella flava]MBG6085277.1 aryl-alcohol dehydrogenase-like predicted oxidoreductase [Zhihengliuella flava]